MQTIPAPDATQALWSLTRDDLVRAPHTEWLLTNALGGYALGSVTGTPLRRYHGLLISATKPPVARVSVLSAVDELLILAADTPQPTRLHLTPFQFAAHEAPPPPPPSLIAFERDALGVRWVHRVEHQGHEVRVEKMVHLYDGRNAVRIKYAVRAPGLVVRLCLRPLLRLLSHHRLCEADERARIPVHVRTIEGGCVVTRSGAGVHLASPESLFVDEPAWWEGIRYTKDEERGQASLESLFSPGVFEWTTVPAAGTSVLTLHASCEATEEPSTIEDAAQSERRIADATRRAIIHAGGDRVDASCLSAIAHLVRAGDQFIVQRRDGELRGRSIIAGYPWFSDWGRDSMICIPGLMLACARLEDARSTLETFARHRHNGLIPNRFRDETGTPEYNTADASLLFIKACCELARVEDTPLDGPLLDACLEVVEAYRTGTDFGIALDTDGLVRAGDATTQLTWMDATHDGEVFTPRFGKAIEINALWHHGLLALAAQVASREPARRDRLTELAHACAQAINDRMWNEQDGCLFDRLEPRPDGSEEAIAEIRPNQIFAISLDHAPVSGDRAVSVLETVERELLTPMGLRTLSPDDPSYCPHYEGDMRRRDEAYHNGTVWPWLIGPYVDAVLRLRSASEVPALRKRLEPLIASLGDGCLGQLAEVYDGEPVEGVQRPDGCCAQAWSVSEVLRSLVNILRASQD